MVKKAAHATPNNRLKAARKERGWTQQQVADRIGAPLSLNISRWENGTTSPSAYYIERLCHLFGKTISELGLSQIEGQSKADQTTPHEQAHPPLTFTNNEPGISTPTLTHQQDHLSVKYTRIWMLPYLRNPFFLGRDEILTRLRNLLQSGQTTALCQPQAISGLGGIGKTQVALEYAFRYAGDYQAVLWIQADRRDALVTGYFQIAQAIEIPERNEREQSVVIEAVKNWLRQHPNWLLILDNADELALLPEFLPAPIRGHLLLTTRTQALGHLANRIEIETLDHEKATLLLLRRSGLLDLEASLVQSDLLDRQAAEQLAWELGGLPLALDQAGAYLEETGCSLEQYLNLYRSHRSDLLRHRGNVVSDHPDSVATTLSISFESVKRRSIIAADLLRLCAILHPDAIPEELFLQGAVHLGPILSTIESDPLAFNQALAVIQSYSFLRRASREHTLTIHRLTQAVIVDAMRDEEREKWTERAIAALNMVFPEVRYEGWGQWERCERLLPHVLTVEAASVPMVRNLELASLLIRTADYLLQRTQYEQAEPLYLRALHIREQSLGSEHSQVAFPLSGLGDLYQEQGNYQQAELFYLRALRLWEQAPTQEYPEVAWLLNNLAILYYEQGNHQRAEQLLQQALHIDQQMCGHEHRNSAARLNNLAVLYIEQGNHQRAEPLLQRVLHIDEQVLGPEHPDVAFPLINLADLYREQGRYEQAEILYLRALHLWEQTIGRDHPQVAFPLNGLANLYRDQGFYEQAKSFYQRALTIREQRHRAQHPETAETLHDFARFYELQNQLDQALALYQQALAIRERRLGPAHPRTLDTRTRYACLLRVCGRHKEAAMLEGATTSIST
ncbi:MAG TPA: FxSxx-COOH system tetratricopeptide repeat protein [Ktedonobacteraceae bacterium]|nr:FxSxx-COOH system tetratricopeptide repeat protein [Ktedonobacteraceae bacterium]